MVRVGCSDVDYIYIGVFDEFGVGTVGSA